MRRETSMDRMDGMGGRGEPRMDADRGGWKDQDEDSPQREDWEREEE
jgi:hypothetical protein